MAFMQNSGGNTWQDVQPGAPGYGSMMQQHAQQCEAAASGAAAPPATLQPVVPRQETALSYAAIREASAVNQAADCAAGEARRTIAAAQHSLHAVLNPEYAAMSLDGSFDGSADDSGGRRRGTRSMMTDHSTAALLTVAQASHGGGGRPNKGLRHFSMKVCEKVESKGTTTYNEVADELVAELKDGTLEDGICYDEKNIRRRVYDAINVLMALDIIAKEKKAIIWRGFPANRGAAQQIQRLQTEQMMVMAEVSRKMQYLGDLVEQQRALKHLLDRNTRNPDASSNGTALHLPFILVQSKPDATVEVQISNDMQDVQFSFFNYPFEIHDDALVLHKMLEHEEMMHPTAAPMETAGGSADLLGDPSAAAAALMDAAAAAQALQQQQQLQMQQMQGEQQPQEEAQGAGQQQNAQQQQPEEQQQDAGTHGKAAQLLAQAEPAQQRLREGTPADNVVAAENGQPE
eukprot:GHRR01010747.1.p1 GENE.GHRR01010747.1~~GHRR01010747.1.p1  ORF type:complete len:460 (+),score=243.21 GHRR01010747.1:191-1570(+)